MPGQEDGSGFGSPDECLNMHMMRTAGCRMMVHLRKRRRAEKPSAWMLFGMLHISKREEIMEL
jgi:hypothetical protein